MSDFKHREKQIEEQKHLDTTLKLLKDKYDKRLSSSEDIKSEYSRRLKEAREKYHDPEGLAKELADISDYIEREKNIDLSESELKEIRYQLDKPYFANLIFRPESFNKDINIRVGKYAFITDDQKYNIVDWRSPIASLYYNYLKPAKDAKYEFTRVVGGKETGVKIKGDLKARKKIDIEDRKITSIYDTSEELNVLTKTLEEKSGGVLDEIIETIQSEQNDIIRFSGKRACLVQGVAGSGKTTVAIHRISYLFYTYKDLTVDNTMFLVSSPILDSYLRRTLNDFDVSQEVIHSLYRDIVNFLFSKKYLDEENYIDFDKEKVNLNANKLKNTESFYNELLGFIRKYEEKVIKTIVDIPEIAHFDFKSRILNMSDVPILERIQTVVDEILELANINETDSKNDEYERENYKSEFENKIIFTRKEINKIKSTVNKLNSIKSKFNSVEICSEFLGSVSKQHFKLNKSFNIYSIDDVYITFLITKLIGGNALFDNKYKYIFIDEAQDFGFLFYKCIKHIKSSNGITMLGDINQSVQDDGSISKWEDISKALEIPIQNFVLPTCYRSTRQIVNYVSSFLSNFYKEYLPLPYKRDGKKPVIENIKDTKSLLKTLANNVKKTKNNEPEKSIVFIDEYGISYDDIRSELDGMGCNLIKIDKHFKDFRSNGVYYVKSEDVKGLEFSSVFYITNCHPDNITDKVNAKRFYVNCTRAINELKVFVLSKSTL